MIPALGSGAVRWSLAQVGLCLEQARDCSLANSSNTGLERILEATTWLVEVVARAARAGMAVGVGHSDTHRLRKARYSAFATLFLGFVLAACGGSESHQAESYDVTDHFPHDPTAYTQGLVRADSVLFESTGLYGHSEVRRVDIRSGQVLASRPLAANRFGEGLALLKGRLYQLTWKEGIAYSYDAATLTPRDSFQYAGEGWGLTTDGTSLIMSDGSDSLRVVSPATFQVQRVVHVRYNGAPIYQLNELEYVNGEVLANVYQANWVLRIDPVTGLVREAIDFAELYPDRPDSADVMNGIALAPDGRQLLLTGKLWPVMFQVRLHSPPEGKPQ
jgi:glutamine cyclotransferase